MTRAWIELPDDNRQTGRTTRMMEAIKACESRPIIVVAGNMAQATFIKRQLQNDGIDVRGIKFTPISEFDAHRRGMPIATKVFYDHLAVELWQRDQIEHIVRTAERMMKDSAHD